MNKQLLKEIAELEAKYVINAETAAGIRAYYENRDQRSPNRLGIILGIPGALLIGSGLLLIIAHNWDNLGKLIKTIFAFLPLLLAQLLSAYTLVKQKDNRTWKECSGVFLFFAIPASVSLISQIYQVDGTLASFLLTWILLAVPLIYLLDAAVVMLLCIAAVTWYATLIGYFDRPPGIPYFYLLVLLFMAPRYYQLTKKITGNLLFITNLFICISISIVLGCFIQGSDHWYPYFFAVYLLLFCIFYFLGNLQITQHNDSAGKPFYLAGLSGILVILFLWSFEWLWKGFNYQKENNIFFSPLPYLIIAGVILAGWLIKKNRIGKTDAGNHLIGFSFAIFLVCLIFRDNYFLVGTLAINAWILFVAITYIRKGSRENHFGILNFGLFILGILAVCRFFDETIPFVWRGVFFLLTGIAFFVSNYLLLHKRKAQTKQ